MASKLIKANATYLNIDFFAADQFFLIYNVKSSIRPNVTGHIPMWWWLGIVQFHFIATDIFTWHHWTVPDNYRAQPLHSKWRRGRRRYSHRWHSCCWWSCRWHSCRIWENINRLEWSMGRKYYRLKILWWCGLSHISSSPPPPPQILMPVQITMFFLIERKQKISNPVCAQL